jgi:uncharacterized membrane protein YgdD (TMEM256/DUF423 family)
MTPARTIVIAALLGLTGVAAGAFGAHGLRDHVDAHALEVWATGARYQQIHAVALLVVGMTGGPWTRARGLAAVLLTVGMLVFAGTLYGLALGGPKILGAITPLGGLALIAGWAALVWHGIVMARTRRDETQA